MSPEKSKDAAGRELFLTSFGLLTVLRAMVLYLGFVSAQRNLKMIKFDSKQSKHKSVQKKDLAMFCGHIVQN